MDYLRTALTGWAAFLLFVASLLLPYLIRRTRSHGVPFLKQLWPHYWIGYLRSTSSSAFNCEAQY